MLTTPNPVSSASYFDHPNPDPLGTASTSSTKGKQYHDSKRIKVEAHHGQAQSTSLTPPVMNNSTGLDCVGPFDEDPYQFRSFEIDYSKVYGPTGQAR
ncbi:hypothetical protein ESCO_003804 [Escovopsis weberi]|uniref:Uncharacterized protein n=1 Tax=Escovopsis weberi TaxID=150374 RepID=A0A0M8N9U5_ESCWE|nr:hypothetical protein ESCO_003804 [Escovopsis weberi]